MRLWSFTLRFDLKKQYKKTNKQSNLLNLTTKKEVAKSEKKIKQNKTLMETIIVIIVIAKTNMGNNSKSGNVEKKQNKQ